MYVIGKEQFNIAYWWKKKILPELQGYALRLPANNVNAFSKFYFRSIISKLNFRKCTFLYSFKRKRLKYIPSFCEHFCFSLFKLEKVTV